MWIPRYRSPIGALNALAAAFGPAPEGGAAGLPGSPGELVVMASASDALHAWLRALGTGGTVVLPAYTCLRVVQAIAHAGWRPAFVDVDRDTLSMDPVRVAARVASGAGSPVVVLATHLHGMPLPLDELKALAADSGAWLVEDCAMALGAVGDGALVGSTGDAAIFSFGLGKPLSLGLGGALFHAGTRSPTASGLIRGRGSVLISVASRAGLVGEARMRLQDSLRRIMGVERGALDAGFSPVALTPAAASYLRGLVSGETVERVLEASRTRSAEWLAWIGSLGSKRVRTFRTAPGSRPCCPGIPLLAENRAVLARALAQAGVDSSTYFSYCAADVAGQDGPFEGARWVAGRILMLPNDARLDLIGERVRQILHDYALGA